MWNDKESSIDLLGHQHIANTVISIMDEQNLRPLTIGVYGSWGVGKSSILSLIQNELKDDKDTLCIFFNGWLFQGYEDTRSALMETVVEELIKLQPADKKIIELGKKLLKRINWLKVAKTAGGLALTAVARVPSAALFGIPALISSLTKSHESHTESDKTTVTVKTQSEESFLKKDEDEPTAQNQIHAFREELKELINSSKVSRVVVLVDDLDRCLPPSVIDILEAIRLFLFVEGSIFILAADERMIEYAVTRHFPDLPPSLGEYTKHYLEKLVQIPIRVPALNQLQAKNYIRLLLIQNALKDDFDTLKKIVNAFESSKSSPFDNKDITYDFITKETGKENNILHESMIVAEQLGAMLSEELRGNPRNIKRFLNTLFFRLRVAKIYKIEASIKMDVLTKLMILERFHGSEFDLILSETSNSNDGKSEFIRQLETYQSDIEDTSGRKKKTKEIVEKTWSDSLSAWANFQPAIKDIDLRPYIFISRDKVIDFKANDDLPANLIQILDVLQSGSRISMSAKADEIRALSTANAKLLFKSLKDEALKISDWDRPPNQVQGIIYLSQQIEDFEKDLVELLDAIPPLRIKNWMLTNLSGLRTNDGKAAKKIFFEKIISSDETEPGLKKLATNLSNGNF